MSKSYMIDGCQYSNWSRKIFLEMIEGGLNAVQVTIAYHENFKETVANITKWRRLFQKNSDLIMPGYFANDIDKAKDTNKVAIFFGLQNASPIEDDISLVSILHSLGVRFMQLSYNNQSLLASGYLEKNDAGITRMGREVIKEMNNCGMVVDMSHSGERSTLEAIDISQMPVAITHANPYSWAPVARNKSKEVLKALSKAGGIIGFSLYPYHLANQSGCSFDSFCKMVADTIDLIGIDHIAIGSDLCQDQPKEQLHWMRKGKWTHDSSGENDDFPIQPSWFMGNRDFKNLASSFTSYGFSQDEVDKIMGDNWYKFYTNSFCNASLLEGEVT